MRGGTDPVPVDIMRRLRAFLVLAFLGSIPLLATPLSAQQADVLTGRVTGPDGNPISGARIEAISAETEMTRSGLTDGNGRYMIIFPDGGGRYVLRVSYLGMADAVRTLTRDGEELLVTNVQLSTQAIQLDAINVQAQRPVPGQGQAGEQSTALSQEMMNRLPLPDLDPSTLALLTAGVTGTTLDSISGRMGFSVAGMSDLLNQITVDGVILGEGMSVPEEGVRRTQVTTSTFDASRGGFAGGQVSMMTARGTNRLGGSFSYTLNDDALQMNSSATANAFTTHRWGGSFGGPALRNRLFYNGSFGVTRTTNHRFALAADDPLAAQRSGVATDSIGRFLDILDQRYSFPVSGQTGNYNQYNDNYSLLGRVDWNAVQRRSMSQTLSLSMQGNWVDQDSTSISSFDLLQHGGDSERSGRSARATLTSRFGTNWTNTLAVSFGEQWSEQLPYLELPEGRVRVTSDFEDGTRATQALVFGGNRNMPSESYNRDLQLSEDISFLLPVGNHLHRLKVGGSLQKTREIDRSTNNLFGSFTFASLADFEANRPERYERSLSERDTRTGAVHAGLYVGDTWRISQPLELTLGLRWDRSELDQQPAYNPLIEERFGRRTDISPAMAGWSPRAGFNYRLSGQGQPQKALQGGIGVFAGRVPTRVFSTAVRQTGLPGSDQRLVCIGEAVPVPDWDRYLLDPTLVPGTCEGGASGTDPLAQRAPAVTLIDPDQSLPTSVRFDLGYRTQLPLGLSGNFRYTYSLGKGLWGYRDLNLDEQRYFLLGNEDRPFFGDPSGIVERTGATSMSTSRLHSEFGNVFDVVAERESRAHQLTATVSGMLWRKLTVLTNYTLGFAEEQGSGAFQQIAVAGNPNVAEWATSSNDRRHTLNLNLMYAITPEIEIAASTRISSGTPFTPMVDRDINGDGASNDRAFVFDPAASPDTALASGMARLLGSVPGGVRECLESQFGGIAARNSCRNPWTESLDMSLNLRPNLPRVERRLTVSVNARNVLTGLDQVIHGRDDLKGWGEGQRADSRLLEVNGFDPVARAFRYEVNEGFGQARRGQNAFRTPFAISISARLMVGGQPQMANRPFGGGMPGFGGGMGGFGMGMGGRGGFGGGEFAIREAGFDLGALMRGGAGMNLDSLLNSMVTNPVRRVLALQDSIRLTEAQLAQVAPISDTLDAQLERRKAAVRPAAENLLGSLGRQGGGLPPNALQQLQLEIQPQIEGGRREGVEAMRQVQRVLTEAQWAMLPQDLRATAQGQQRGAFNPVALLDRMLANPLPVLLSLRDSLAMTPQQVAGLEAVSAALQEKLNARREALGKRFDNLRQGEQGRIFGEIQPDIERTRREVQDALKEAEKLLTKEQWQKVPEQVKNPFQAQLRRMGGGGL